LLLLKQSDEAAFAQIYNRHAPKVRSIAYSKLNSIEGAQEIVQETFMNLWERRYSLNIESLSNYLAVSVKYQVINYIKKQVVIRKHSDYYRSFAKVIGEETSNDVELMNLYEALDAGVKKLPAKTQAVFKLSRLEHKSISEIAIELNLSQKAIKYHITRSLKELRFHLKEFIIPATFVLALFS
jgi:RNA polymerase sigma-70 factor (ECF subfamily)